MLRVPLLQVIAVMRQRSSPGAHDGAIQPAVEEVAGGAVHHGPVRGEPRSATPAAEARPPQHFPLLTPCRTSGRRSGALRMRSLTAGAGPGGAALKHSLVGGSGSHRVPTICCHSRTGRTYQFLPRPTAAVRALQECRSGRWGTRRGDQRWKYVGSVGGWTNACHIER